MEAINFPKASGKALTAKQRHSDHATREAINHCLALGRHKQAEEKADSPNRLCLQQTWMKHTTSDDNHFLRSSGTAPTWVQAGSDTFQSPFSGFAIIWKIVSFAITSKLLIVEKRTSGLIALAASKIFCAA